LQISNIIKILSVVLELLYPDRQAENSALGTSKGEMSCWRKKDKAYVAAE
jgi:hypothetical protein